MLAREIMASVEVVGVAHVDLLIVPVSEYLVEVAGIAHVAEVYRAIVMEHLVEAAEIARVVDRNHQVEGEELRMAGCDSRGEREGVTRVTRSGRGMYLYNSNSLMFVPIEIVELGIKQSSDLNYDLLTFQTCFEILSFVVQIHEKDIRGL